MEFGHEALSSNTLSFIERNMFQSCFPESTMDTLWDKERLPFCFQLQNSYKTFIYGLRRLWCNHPSFSVVNFWAPIICEGLCWTLRTLILSPSVFCTTLIFWEKENKCGNLYKNQQWKLTFRRITCKHFYILFIPHHFV